MPDKAEQLAAVSPVLSMDRCREIFGSVERAAKSFGAPDVEAIFGAHRGALTRFANNTIHQNVSEQGQWISVRVLLDQRTTRATPNRFAAYPLRSAADHPPT